MIVQNVLDYFGDSYHETFHWPEMAAPEWDRKVIEYNLKFEKRFLGKLDLPTGKVVASDPLVFFDQPPFSLDVPAGKHDVILSTATISGDERRVAFAMLKFGEIVNILTWAPIQAGETMSHYSVDSGTGCFMDVSTQSLLNRRLEDPTFDNFLFGELQRSSVVDKFSWVNHSLSDDGENNVVAFSTGWGDGSYSTYAGFDSSKNLICFVTDFEIMHYMDNTD